MTYRERRTLPLRLGGLVFDPQGSKLTDTQGRLISVRGKSLRVLAALAERNGETVEKGELIDAIWSGRSVSDDSLVQCIKDIRSALGDHDRRLLRTAVGRGYSLHGVRDMQSAPGSHPLLLVSPLRTSGNETEAVEIAQVVTENLIVDLARRAGLKITTDESRRDDALYVINGRVSRTQEEVRAFVQLVRGSSSEVAFAQTWSAPIAEAASLPRQIVDKIGTVARVHMFNHAGETVIDRDDAELTTQELLAKAAYHMSRIDLENREVARAATSLAIEREPRNAMALAMRVSATLVTILQVGYEKLSDSPDYCLDLADRAVAIAPHVDFVMLTRGCARLWLRSDHKGARSDFGRALEISPVFHLAHQFVAVSEILSGEPSAGITRINKVLELGTLANPRVPHYLALVALGHTLEGDEKGALRASVEAHDRAPGDPWCTYVHAAAVGPSDISRTDEFRRMIAKASLPVGHFRDLPFTRPGDVVLLEQRLALAGYPGAD